eukprot:TRINITY_DN9461_c2_g1_i1.p1 TRINITY_DN9461_c2_g1~~TRINITY_DN9461_c2_g1_i1.p1  ORF type:complete len:456 (+),score=81.16 TRINITY_DN9461_c2_g1_i1:61-1428(+)
MTPPPSEAEVVDPFKQIASLSEEQSVLYVSDLKEELEKRANDEKRYIDAEAEIDLFEKAVKSVTRSSTVEEDLTKCEECVRIMRGRAKGIGGGDRPTKIPENGEGGLGFTPTEPCSMLNTPMERRLQTFATILFNFFTGLPLFLFAYIMMYFIPFMWPFLICYNIYMLWDITKTKHPRRYCWLRYLSFWKIFARYFPIRLRVPDATPFTKVHEDKAANYLFILHPHGVHSFGAVTNFGTGANDIDEKLPELFISVQTLGIQFWLPLWREFARWAAMGDASKEALNNVLTGQPGDSALLVVGGAEEALDAIPGTSDLIIKKRKGFARIAVQNGTALVPCFSFGENDVYRTFNKDPATRPFLRWIQAKLGFAIPLFLGRGVFNYRFGLLPHRRQITTVIGKPIRVKKWEGKWDPKDPELQEHVTLVHQEYMEGLQELYDRYKNVQNLSRTAEMNFVQ